MNPFPYSDISVCLSYFYSINFLIFNSATLLKAFLNTFPLGYTPIKFTYSLKY